MSAALNKKLKQVREHLERGAAARARSLCQEILRQAPRNPDALFLLGVARLAEGDAVEAVPPLHAALLAAPRHGAALEHLGLAHLMLGQFAEAEDALTRAAALPGAPASALMRLGIAVLEQGRVEEALPALRQALALDEQDLDCHLNLGRALAQAGDAAGARERFHAVLRLAPGHPEALYNLGVLALQRDELDDARQWFEELLARSPHYVDARVGLAHVLQRESRLDEAAEALRQALALAPGHAAARSDYARTLALQGRPEQAREEFLAALRAAPGFAAAREGLAEACLALGRLSEAIEHLRATLQAEPDHAGAHAALAGALFEAGRLDEAEAAAQRALALDPAGAPAHATLANVHLVRGELDRAIAALESGYERSGASNLLGMLAHQLRQACDWVKWQAAWTEIKPALERGAALGSPFWLLCEPVTPRQQLAYTRRWAEARFGTAAPGLPAPDRGNRRHSRLRVGYLSSDLQEHAAAYLIAEVLECHDRERFEIYAYSHGPDDESAMRRRLRAACEHFIDIAREPDDAAAARMRSDALDVLVDLKGYTAGDRLTIMARRPCPVQVTWLGYPGTTGAGFIDYLIADPFVVPPGREDEYSERVVRMPHCYQPNDRKRTAASPLTRAEYGIPERAFVFCCFNQTYKITPDVYDVWMRLLARVPDSVLWLVESNRWAKEHLLAAARSRGVSAERLVFAPRLPYDRHLARYAVADLALDTFPYTSHTTLSDALWCGCPTVGLCGETFAARVSGSLLTAAGLPDLVTCGLPEYEALAHRLATQPAPLQELRARVARARDASPLFDSAAFARDLERLYLELVGG